MQVVKITCKDKSKITIENARDVKASITGNMVILSKDKVTQVKIKDIAKYEIVES